MEVSIKYAHSMVLHVQSNTVTQDIILWCIVMYVSGLY